MTGGILSKNDQAPREVAYYGGVRKGFEQAREGIEEVIQHLEGLHQQDPQNGRLERYIGQLQKLLTKIHRLQMRSSKVRDRRPRPKQSPTSFLQPSAPQGPIR